ncbi:uncharacterized protein V6R79_005714 [Siganus canaliculatus]
MDWILRRHKLIDGVGGADGNFAPSSSYYSRHKCSPGDKVNDNVFAAKSGCGDNGVVTQYRRRRANASVTAACLMMQLHLSRSTKQRPGELQPRLTPPNRWPYQD